MVEINSERVKKIWQISEDKQIDVLDLQNGFYAFKTREDRIFRIAYGTAKAILGRFVINDNVVYVSPATFNDGIDPEIFGERVPTAGFDNAPGSDQLFLEYNSMMERLSNITGNPARRLANDEAMQDFRPTQVYDAKMCPVMRELYPLNARFVTVRVHDADGVVRELNVSVDAVARLTPQE